MFILLAPLVFAAGAAFAPQAASSPAGPALDYEFFKTRVQPVFLLKRPGHARCYVCHSTGTNFRLQRLSPGAKTWDDEQSRRNFEAAQRQVIAGDPQASHLLMHPLAAEAGGDPFHGGGKHWDSQNDPEWQTMAQWVRSGGTAATSSAASSLDYEFYRTRIEPIFLKVREGGVACFNCHSMVATRLRLQPLAAGSTSWTPEQSRRNFEAAQRVVVPGDPLKSRLLLHPLAPEAGGDPQHTGGKFWKDQNDPEWQTLASWVRTGSAKAGAAVAADQALDFEFFKANVQPVFLLKRPGHARCYVCHSSGTNFRLQRLPKGATTWTEEQSRQNFEAAVRQVVPGDPQASHLLMHPLAAEAGGDPFHGGGKHWDSQNDPEWRKMAEWVRGQKLTESSR
jgi:hypothetical protein